ncbi:HTH-type transcriptional regulator AdhR (plasmid) [Caballeronia sp. SBC1]|uniref:MerR family transcriptional regulator n=1 Tax=unclassified Caballeronia TaxID=2646786 RepID=UPI0013E1506A|nr:MULTISPECIES: MerR family transcriptional regulator [unclassified Caballeronia]QIE26454.1 HTH-type transcriptional regulator AdhR [Caballeronia sp. SBC2]QIN64229.1 HTH-type transcriptional regulator AdhR [Caballeronia sp. SBC1]
MKIGDIAGQTGLTAHTIRYYERIGLLPFAPRDSTGQRVYDASILTWIEFLGRLKTTGMSIQEMLRYAGLRAQGAATEEARCKLLTEHRDQVRLKVAELQACLLVLDNKIAGYAHTQQRTEKCKTRSNAKRIRKAA